MPNKSLVFLKDEGFVFASPFGHTIKNKPKGDFYMNSQEGVLLNRVMRNAQMGIIGIDSILPKATGAIRPALEAQKKEYVELACEARQLMRRTGENPKNVPHPIRVMATHMGKMKSSIDPSSKHMAKMMTMRPLRAPRLCSRR